MAAVELWSGLAWDRFVTLAESVYTVGSDAECADIVVDDPTVSQLHVTLERVGTVWLIRDLGSRNGTAVNGERLVSQRRVRDGDEIVFGRSRLVFRDETARQRSRSTDALAGPPANLTRTERAVLIELCRPLMSHNAFHPPASVREIGARLFIGKNAVQAHLSNLYDKFGLYEDGEISRRVLLANAAMERGAVSLADLAASPDGGGASP